MQSEIPLKSNDSLNGWLKNSLSSGDVTHIHQQDPFIGSYGDFPIGLSSDLASALSDIGINKLYKHQIESYHEARLNHNVLLTTGTASGKTLGYLLPILDEFLKCDLPVNALFLYPTKALTYDQNTQAIPIIQKINEIRKSPNKTSISLAVYDGDTPQAKRAEIRKKTNFILSNPDMVHFAILPNHTAWEYFLTNLRFIVLDELHTYRGVFGSHVANIFRRLKRVLSLYGSNPIYISTSATIGNPVELAENIFEEKFIHIHENSAPRGPKTIVFYNPPIQNIEFGIRKSAVNESVRLASDFMQHKIQSLVFQVSRKSVERSLRYFREANPEEADYVQAYRSGYLAAERRKLETELRNGKTKVLFSTNALELGIDIGGITSVIITGYPGSITSTIQQIGRAGRQNNPSYAVLIANNSPIDQYLINRPEFLFFRSPENAYVNPNNPIILLFHLRCAAQELMFSEEEAFGKLDWKSILPLIEILEVEGHIHKSNHKYFWISKDYAAGISSIRNTSGSPVKLITTNEDKETVIGQVDYTSSMWMVHPGAVYMHLGEEFMVKDLNLTENKAYLHKSQHNYFTEAKRNLNITILGKDSIKSYTNYHLSFGKLNVESKIVGYKEILWDSKQTIAEKELDLPAFNLETEGFWITFSEKMILKIKSDQSLRIGKNDYGKNWESIKKLVRARDFYTCQLCGLIEENQAHHVHHKKPFKLFSNSEEANHLTNLIALCPSCHQKVEVNVRVRNGLSGFSFLLRNIAPLFLMCDYADIDVFYESNSDLAGGEAICIFYDLIPFGIGLSQNFFKSFNQLIPEFLQHIRQCPCVQGCPACVGPVMEFSVGVKEETIYLLSLLLEGDYEQRF
jgi:DEAD/DEAH box helicase domain-containing protein